LRFTNIRYLPRESDWEPQRFLYTTRIGLGIEIQGEGETLGNRESADGIHTSALKFWSHDPRSLIREGSGYWQYIPAGSGTRFLTWYDYRTRFGWCGRLFDRLIFRPLLGWATAWSFDRLRLWIIDRLPPERRHDPPLVRGLRRGAPESNGIHLHSDAKPRQGMRSIYERALGSDFARLHPEVQRRFGFSSRDATASIGTGMMETIWHGAPYTLPFLYIGAWRRIMFPDSGRDVPFRIENYAYLDSLGRETVTWIRTFQTNRVRRFDAYMIYSEQRQCIVDYLGTHQHLAVDIDLSVAPNGGLRLRSGAQRFYEGPVQFRFPMIFSGVADVCEWYDERDACFRIEVFVANRTWGPLFGYKGHFQVEWRSISTSGIPANVLPRRTEHRE